MKKVWEWIKGKVWPFVKAHGVEIVAGMMLVGAFLAGKGILRAVLNVATGKVEKPNNFVRLPGDETHLLVRIGNTWQTAKVPGGEASKVTAIQVTPGGTVIMEKRGGQTIDQV